MPVPLSRMAISTLVAQVARRGGQGRLVGAVRLGLLALLRRVEAVGNQVQQHARDLLREEIGGAGFGIERFCDRHVEARLFGPRAVIGEVQRLLDHRVDVDRRSLARALARVQQHVLDDRVGALAVAARPCRDCRRSCRSVRRPPRVRRSRAARARGTSREFVEQFARERREIVDEVQRVLDLVGDAGGELAERGEFFRLHEPVLRLAQIVERGGEFLACAPAPRRTGARSRSRSPPDRRRSGRSRSGVR